MAATMHAHRTRRALAAYVVLVLMVAILGPGLAVYGVEDEVAVETAPVEESPTLEPPAAEPVLEEPVAEPPLAAPLADEPAAAPDPVLEAPAVEPVIAPAVTEDVPPVAGPAFPSLTEGGVRIFGPGSGTYTAGNVDACEAPVPDGFELTLQVFTTAEGTFVSFSSTHPIAKVVVCGGEAGSNVYSLGSAMSGSWLHAPAVEGIYVAPCAIDVYFCAQAEGGCLDIYKFEDDDRDGDHDAGEAMLEGVAFVVYDEQGGVVGSGRTNSAGRLCFRGLAEGTYAAQESLPDGWENTTPLRQSTLVCPGQTSALCFGNVRTEAAPEPAQLTIYKFNDGNRDGTRASTEALLPGWQFIIFDGTGTEVQRVTTGAGGSVQLELAAGTYAVQEVAQTGWSATTPTRRTITLTAGGQADVWFGNAEEFLPFTPGPEVSPSRPSDPFLPFTGGEYALLLGGALASGAFGLSLRTRRRAA